MEQRLTQAQLQQIVAEVQQLSERNTDELSPQQVREILQELNLPPELLEDAMVQLHRREALEVQQKRNRWIIGSIAAALALIVGGGLLFSQNRQQTLNRVIAQQSRITLATDTGSTLTTIPRQSGELYYRVTLADAPVGEKLSLSCHWLASTGQIVHQNSYQTKPITAPVWDTFCRYAPGAAAPPGTWKVQMYLNGRILGEETFTLQ